MLSSEQHTKGSSRLNFTEDLLGGSHPEYIENPKNKGKVEKTPENE